MTYAIKVNYNGWSSTLRRQIQCLQNGKSRSDKLPSKVSQDTKQDKSMFDTRCQKSVRDAAIQARQKFHEWTTD